MLDQFVARGDAAGPALAGMVEAKLVDRGRIDPAQTEAAIADLDLIALDNFWNAGDVGRLGQRRQQKYEKREQEFHEHPKRPDSNWADINMRADCGGDSVGTPAPGRAVAFNLMR